MDSDAVFAVRGISRHQQTARLQARGRFNPTRWRRARDSHADLQRRLFARRGRRGSDRFRFDDYASLSDERY